MLSPSNVTRVASKRSPRSPRIIRDAWKSSKAMRSTTDLGALVGARRPARICANLPYNIATVLLTNWLES